MRSTVERSRMFWYAPQTTIAGSTTRTETIKGVDDRDGGRDAELLGREQWGGYQHSESERRRQRGAQQRRTGSREGPDRRFLRIAQSGELLPVAVNHVDRVVHPDPDRQRRDDRRDQCVGDVQQRHRAQHADEDEHDRPHGDDPQRRLAQRHPEEEMARMPRATAIVVLIAPVCPPVIWSVTATAATSVRNRRDGVVVAEPERLDFLLEQSSFPHGKVQSRSGTGAASYRCLPDR